MDARSYLARIGLVPGFTPTLADLHERHLLTVPFENLDILAGRPMRLDEAHFLDKIVRRRRGGFCYELNGAFAWLLRGLGYEVTLLAAEVRDERRDRYGIPFDHLVLRVDLDVPWLADVGFGDSFLYPVPLDGGEVRIVGERYRVRVEGEWRYLERSDRPQYRFTLEPRALRDFAPGFTHHTTSPDSSFTRKRMVSLARPAGRVTLTDDRLIETRKGERTETPLGGEDAWRDALAGVFGLSP